MISRNDELRPSPKIGEVRESVHNLSFERDFDPDFFQGFISTFLSLVFFLNIMIKPNFLPFYIYLVAKKNIIDIFNDLYIHF